MNGPKHAPLGLVVAFTLAMAATSGFAAAASGANTTGAATAYVEEATTEAPAETGNLAAGHHHGQRAGFLGINWWAWDSHRPPMGWFLLDFGVFVGLLMWAVKAPLQRVFVARHERVKRTIAQAAQAHAKASHAHHDIRRRLAAMEAEIRDMENATVQDGEAERAQMVGAAEAYAARLRHEAQRQSEQELRRSEERLRRRMLRQVVRSAERKVAEEITAQDHVRLLDEAIARLASQGPKGGVRTAGRAANAGSPS